jgi:outer membrane protein assembly factor BamD (BamD/ComL family)
VGDLREEIRLIDRARAAMRGGAPEQALDELKIYARRFPRGSLSQEAFVLKLEALKMAGQRERAESMARRYLAQHPDSAYSPRLERIIGSK